VQRTWFVGVAGSFGDNTAARIGRAVDLLDHLEHAECSERNEWFVTAGRSWHRPDPAGPHERSHDLRDEPGSRAECLSQIRTLEPIGRAFENGQRTNRKVGTLGDFESHSMRLADSEVTRQGPSTRTATSRAFSVSDNTRC
jgi:hypothetical protein